MSRSLCLVACMEALALVGCGGGGGGSDDPCAEIACSDHGTCVPSGGSPTCDCESGFNASGLTCVEDAFAGSCDMPASHGCIDYTGSSYSSSMVQYACSQFSSAVYSTAPCSTANRVGRCTVFAGTETEATTSSYPPMTEVAAQAGCVTGTWVSG